MKTQVCLVQQGHKSVAPQSILKRRNDGIVAGGRQDLAIVPWRAFLNPYLTAADLRVLAAMGRHCNRAGVCWPSTLTLAEAAGMTPMGALQAIRKLIKHGLVRRLKRRPDIQDIGRFGYSNRYQILFEPGAYLPTFEDLESAIVLQHPRDIKERDRGTGMEPNAPSRTPSEIEINTVLTLYDRACDETFGSITARTAFLRQQAAQLLSGMTMDEVRLHLRAVVSSALAVGSGPSQSLNVPEKLR